MSNLFDEHYETRTIVRIFSDTKDLRIKAEFKLFYIFCELTSPGVVSIKGKEKLRR